jgi:hypothetical protein
VYGYGIAYQLVRTAVWGKKEIIGKALQPGILPYGEGAQPAGKTLVFYEAGAEVFGIVGYAGIMKKFKSIEL